MGMSVGNTGGSMSEPNIVPLIDVLLVLIIIFMVITPTTPQGLDALVPQPTQPTEHQDQQLLDKTILVQVTANGKVLINQDPIEWYALRPCLENILKMRAENMAFVKGEKYAEFAQVARAIDIMR